MGVGGDDWPVVLHTGELVEQVGEHVHGHVPDGLGDLLIRDPGRAHLLEQRVADLAAVADDRGRQLQDRFGVRVLAAGPTGRVSLCLLDLGQVRADVGVRREAVLALVDLGDGDGDPLADTGDEAPAARAPDRLRYPSSSAGLFAMTLVMFGTRPRLFSTCASRAFAAPSAPSGSIVDNLLIKVPSSATVYWLGSLGVVRTMPGLTKVVNGWR